MRYWGVSDAQAAFDRLISLDATERSTVQEVGGGIRVLAKDETKHVKRAKFRSIVCAIVLSRC